MKLLRIVIACAMVFGAMSVVSSAPASAACDPTAEQCEVEVDECAAVQCEVIAYSPGLLLTSGTDTLNCEVWIALDVDGEGNTEIYWVSVQPGDFGCFFVEPNFPGNAVWDNKMCDREIGGNQVFVDHIENVSFVAPVEPFEFSGPVAATLTGELEEGQLIATGAEVNEAALEPEGSLTGEFSFLTVEGIEEVESAELEGVDHSNAVSTLGEAQEFHEQQVEEETHTPEVGEVKIDSIDEPCPGWAQ